MLYSLYAHFLPGAEARRDALHEAFNTHLSQGFPPIRLAGSLRSGDGSRTGVLIILEAKDQEQAKRFLDSSPYALAGLYDRIEIAVLDIEAGSLG